MVAKLDPYELIAVIPCGVIFCIGAFLIYFGLPADVLDQADKLGKLSTSLGDLGLIVIVAFVTGQLLRQVARLLEGPLWRLFGGWPLERAVTAALNPSSGTPDPRLVKAVQQAKQGSAARKGEWQFQLFHDILAQCHSAKSDERVEAMNRNYGFFNGLAVSFLLLIVIAVLRGEYPFAMALVVPFALAFYGTAKAGRDVASQLLAEFKNLGLRPVRHDGDDDDPASPIG